MAKQLPSNYGQADPSPIRAPSKIKVGAQRQSQSRQYTDREMLEEIGISLKKITLSAQEAKKRVHQLNEAFTRGIISNRTFWELLEETKEAEEGREEKKREVLDFWDTL